MSINILVPKVFINPLDEILWVHYSQDNIYIPLVDAKVCLLIVLVPKVFIKPLDEILWVQYSQDNVYIPLVDAKVCLLISFLVPKAFYKSVG